VKIFPRAGLPGWIGIFGIVPFVPFVFLWMLAYRQWPQDKAGAVQ